MPKHQQCFTPSCLITNFKIPSGVPDGILSVSINLSARLQMPKKEAEFFVLKPVGVRGYGRALKRKKQSFITFYLKNIINIKILF